MKTFSTGMRKRRPGPWSGGELREMVAALASGGVAIVLVTHDLEEAAQPCRGVAVLDRGTVTALGAPGDVL